jgi:MinD superfamily P-loop ATPase
LKIVIASGKGGTGKTLIATNLALSVEADQLLDCDVEEPNDYIFIKPPKMFSDSVKILVPEIDESMHFL